MNVRSRPPLRVAILAAGHSRRLGTPKALARVHGLSLLRRTALALLPFGDLPLLVIAPPRAQRYALELRGLPARVLANPRRAEGQSSSVRLAIARAGAAGALLILPVDLVDLRAREIARLVSVWRAAPRRLTARRIDDSGGAPLILPRALFRRAAAASGDQGLKSMFRALPPSARRGVALPSAEADVDTPTDLRAARRRYRSGPPRRA